MSACVVHGPLNKSHPTLSVVGAADLNRCAQAAVPDSTNSVSDVPGTIHTGGWVNAHFAGKVA